MKNSSVLTARSGRDVGAALNFQLASRCSTPIHREQHHIIGNRLQWQVHYKSYSSASKESHKKVFSIRYRDPWRRVNPSFAPITTLKPSYRVHQRRQVSTTGKTLNQWTANSSPSDRDPGPDSQQDTDQTRNDRQPQSQPSSPSSPFSSSSPPPGQDDPLFPPDIFEGVEDTEIFKIAGSGYRLPTPLYTHVLVRNSDFQRALYPFGKPIDPDDGTSQLGTYVLSRPTPTRRQQRQFDLLSASSSPHTADQPKRELEDDEGWWSSKLISWVLVEDMRGRGLSLQRLYRWYAVRVVLLVVFGFYFLVRFKELGDRMVDRLKADFNEKLRAALALVSSDEDDDSDETEVIEDETMMANVVDGEPARSIGVVTKSNDGSPVGGSIDTRANINDNDGISLRKESDTPQMTPVVQVLDPASGELVENPVSSSPTSTPDTGLLSSNDDDESHNNANEERTEKTNPQLSSSSSSWKSWLLSWR